VGNAAPSAEYSEVLELGRGADDVPFEVVVDRVDVWLLTITGGSEAEEAFCEDDDSTVLEVSGIVEASGTATDDGGDEDGIGAAEDGPSDVESAELLGGRGVLDGAGKTLLGPGMITEEEGEGGGSELLVGGGDWLLGGGGALEERGGEGVLELGGGGGSDELGGGGEGDELGGRGGGDELVGGGGGDELAGGGGVGFRGAAAVDVAWAVVVVPSTWLCGLATVRVNVGPAAGAVSR
jgi:hypothetical protein